MNIRDRLWNKVAQRFASKTAKVIATEIDKQDGELPSKLVTAANDWMGKHGGYLDKMLICDAMNEHKVRKFEAELIQRMVAGWGPTDVEIRLAEQQAKEQAAKVSSAIKRSNQTAAMSDYMNHVLQQQMYEYQQRYEQRHNKNPWDAL